MALTENEPVAVVGVGCRLPGGSSSPSKLWDLLSHPRDISQKVPEDRFNLKSFHNPNPALHPGTTDVCSSYFLDEDIGKFDYRFFGIHPAEAEAIDPQHRLLLEVTYEALESAGIPIEKLYGSDTAAYAAVTCNDYQLLQAHDPASLPFYSATGLAPGNASSRLSYFFNWHGPCLTIDTACSSSLVAVNEAVQTLRNQTSRIAIASGTNLIFSPFQYISFGKMGLLSPTGHCRLWDTEADGYARGEGVGALVLKRLSSALEDGDNVLCVIRNTGVNHDGRTTGITMPSALAQAKLMRETYAKSGLDCGDPEDRCQYVEVHGTGTAAGDPQEAKSINMAFFPDGRGVDDHEKILVGSVKTVIGHTEATSGIAGIVKTMLALQNAIVPPNLHFSHINPDVEPFARNFRIATSCEDWPSVPPGQPRRASVNSFGFGGTNAHVILESYDMPSHENSNTVNNIPVIPFVFSAASEDSLVQMVKSCLPLLESNSKVLDLRSLAHTLATRRSLFNFRATFAATEKSELRQKMRDWCPSIPNELSPSAKLAAPTILGVFTGQGAQWITMGAELITHNAIALGVLQELDSSLATLPKLLAPRWTLQDELLADNDTSRLREAEISQPLCTAIQIILVDLLRLAGIQFARIVGHSSGEIAAAYASGLISARDAIRIAFFKGYIIRLAKDEKHKGSMLAAGISRADAEKLCCSPEFQGHLSIAAHNSENNVTLSGDIRAISEAKSLLESRNVFARQLKVDTAYHSRHMDACMDPYLHALQACNIQVAPPQSNGPQWFSSTYEGVLMSEEISDSLTAQYWVNNMRQPVLFASAIEQCLETEENGADLDCIIEIGPHPALRSSVSDIAQRTTEKDYLYLGTLNRGVNDVKSLSQTLGTLWSISGSQFVDLEKFERMSSPNPSSLKFMSCLPTYPWTHDRVLWTESRLSRELRTQAGSFHELLGHKTLDTGSGLRWRNVFKPQDVTWLTGLTLQSHTLLPATMYIIIATEAALQIDPHCATQCVELEEVKIVEHIEFDESKAMELVVTLSNISWADSNMATAYFEISSAFATGSAPLSTNSRGMIKVMRRNLSNAPCSLSDRSPNNLPTTDLDLFYNALNDVGITYNAGYRCVDNMSRKLGYCVGASSCRTVPEDRKPAQLFVPAELLESSMQGVLAAYSAPRDSRLLDSIMPSYFDRVTIRLDCLATRCEDIHFSTTLVDPWDNNIVADINLVCPKSQQVAIRMNGVSLLPFRPITEEDDRQLFQVCEEFYDEFDGDLAMKDVSITSEDKQQSLDAERVSLYALRDFLKKVDPSIEDQLPSYRQALLNSIRYMLNLIRCGEHPNAPAEWLNDKRDFIHKLLQKYDNQDPTFGLIKKVWETFITSSFISGETSILQCMRENDALDRYYESTVGVAQLNRAAAGLVKQIAMKHGGMKVCELGAGTGATTKEILDQVGDTFSNYMYTDISSGFFPNARSTFQDFSSIMEYQVLDVEKSIQDQGFSEYSYDLVVANNVLHATESLCSTLQRARRLLRPGGFFVIAETLGGHIIQATLLMGGLPGWWTGKGDGREYTPLTTLQEWDSLLRQTGFSGIDAVTQRPDLAVAGSAFISQAIDVDVMSLRNPLDFPEPQQRDNLVVLVKPGHFISQILEGLKTELTPRFNTISVVECLSELPQTAVGDAYVLSLIECAAPLFNEIQESDWNALRDLLTTCQGVFWVTVGSWSDNPYAAITVGLFRTLYHELPHTHLQLFDVDLVENITSKMLSEGLLRLRRSPRLSEGQKSRILWTIEPELSLKEGRTYYHRLHSDRWLNTQYNARRRKTHRRLENSETKALIVDLVDNVHELREQHDHHIDEKFDSVSIEVNYSTLHSLWIQGGCYIVGVGSNTNTGEKMLYISDKNENPARVSSQLAFSISDKIAEKPYLWGVISFLLSRQIASLVPPGGTLLVNEPDPILATFLLSDPHLRVKFSTSQPNRQEHWIHIPEHDWVGVVRNKLPSTISTIIDWHPATRGQTLGKRLPLVQLHGFVQLTSSDFVCPESSTIPTSIPEYLITLLDSARQFVLAHENLYLSSASLAPVSALSELGPDMPKSPYSLIQWKTGNSQLRVAPVIDCRQLFSANKSYWLAGLAGDTGRSLADFMISRGARYVALTSRAPIPDHVWIEKHRTRGNKVEYFACDLTDLESVRITRDEIASKLAPLGGAMNGALVLNDMPLAIMSLEAFRSVLKPKVDGTINLDRVFADEPLEWFIGMSSVMATTGNKGQCAYSAANCFMESLMRNRQARGLAGCTIGTSRLVGIGYIERETKNHGRLTKRAETLMDCSGTMQVSEVDLHHMFAEAVLAARPGRRDSAAHILTGIETITSGDINNVQWGSHPKFQHLIQYRKVDSVGEQRPISSQDPVQARLEGTQSCSEATELLLHYSVERLRRLLALSDSDPIPANMSLLDLGVDSLVAVDFRSWLRAELGVSLDIVHFLGDKSIGDIVSNAIEMFMQRQAHEKNE